MAFAAMGAEGAFTDTGGLLVLVLCLGPGLRVLRRAGVFELEKKPDPPRRFPLAGVPEAVIADLVEALGQHMLEEPAHEFLAGDAQGAPSPGVAPIYSI